MSGQQPNRVVDLVQRLEQEDRLDRLANAVAPISESLLGSERMREVLRGPWLGHALHPLLTDLPLGAWMCTSLLDLLGGRESSADAQRLLVVGLALAPPTALTGGAEWHRLTGAERRVGLVHAGLNVGVLLLYTGSLLARRKRRHRLGVVLALAGGLVAGASSYLGGHLTIARKVGTRHPAFEA